jgi:predicted permease
MPNKSFRALTGVALDVRYTLRTLSRTPGFVIAVLSLGMTVGGAAATYFVANWLLHRSAHHVQMPDQLVGLWLTEKGRREEVKRGFSYPQYLAMRDVQDAFSDIAAYAKVSGPVGTSVGAAEEVQEFVTGSYFSLLGVRPYLGRLIGPDDDVDGASPVAVVSHAYWESRFGGDPRAIGASLLLGRDVARVIGVLPADFEGYSLDWNGPTQVWLPMRSAKTLQGMAGMLTMNQTFFMIMGRLRPGFDKREADERAQAWIPRLPSVVTTDFTPNAIYTEPEREMRIARRAQAQDFLGTILVVFGLIVLAAGFNVINFLMGRAAVRRREMAIRVALGSSRARLLRLASAEATIFAVGVAAVGLCTAIGATWLTRRLPDVILGLPRWASPLSTAGAVDGKMIGGAAAVGFGLATIIGLLGAVDTYRDPFSSMKRTRRGWSWSSRRPTVRQVMLTAQIGLATALAVTSVLFARSLARESGMRTAQTDPSSVLMARMLPMTMPHDRMAVFYRELINRLEEAPGVRSVALSFNKPYAGGRGAVAPMTEPSRSFTLPAATVGPRYFATYGIPVVAGREFDALDSAGTAAVVNRRLAERLWPGSDPVGRSFLWKGKERTVIGVVAWERCRDPLSEPTPCVWLPMPFNLGLGEAEVTVRTVGPSGSFTPTLREIVREVGPDVAVTESQPLDSFLASFTRPARATATLAVSLAVLGLSLLAMGCAELFLSMVRQSVREIAVRMAVGAAPARIAATVAARGSVLLGVGAVCGMAMVRLLAPHLSHRLYGITPADPFSYTAGALVVVIVGVTSVLYAARQAAWTAPFDHLRND